MNWWLGACAGEASAGATQIQDLQAELERHQALVQQLEEDLLAAQRRGLGVDGDAEARDGDGRRSSSLNGLPLSATLEDGKAIDCSQGKWRCWLA